MDLMGLLFILLGAAVVVYYGVRLLLFCRMLYPKMWFTLPKSFFTSMGEWAVVTGASEGIGRAYAFAGKLPMSTWAPDFKTDLRNCTVNLFPQLAEQGMNVVIMSRTKVTLDQVAKEIGDATGQRVKVVVTDFIKDNVFSEIEDQLKNLNIGVLVNNVGVLPSAIPDKFLESAELDQTIARVINCNVKTIVKMCKIILPGMESRRKGVIVNMSSGVACIPHPLYSLYSASKVFVERFSQGLQAEYKDKGIIIQAVAPFGVSTRLSGLQHTNTVTLSPEDFVKSSLQYLRAGDKTYGSFCHTVLGWLMQSIPLRILYADSMLKIFQDYVKTKTAQKKSTSTSN